MLDKSEERNDVDARMLVVFDILFNVDENIRNLLYVRRHLNITLILTMHHPHTLSCIKFYDTIDYIFLTGSSNTSFKEKIFEQCVNKILPDYDFFNTVYPQLTKNFNSMVVANSTKPDDTDAIFCYKSKKCIENKKHL